MNREKSLCLSANLEHTALNPIYQRHCFEPVLQMLAVAMLQQQFPKVAKVQGCKKVSLGYRVRYHP